MSLYEEGKVHALGRKKARSVYPEYKQGYLDGLFQRSASRAKASFREATISGLVIEAVASDAEATYFVRTGDGTLVSTGKASDIESAVAAAESDIVSSGRVAVRIGQIVATINSLHPATSVAEQHRLAGKAAQYIVDHTGGASAS